MLLVYIEDITNRHRYIFDLMLKQLLGFDYALSSDKDAFLYAKGPKLIYGSDLFADAVFCEATGFLNKSGIQDVDLNSISFENYQILFPVNNSKSVFPFDCFSAAFYLVSRYEEYSSKQKDQHDRFSSKFSIAKKLNFLYQPVVNQWAKILKRNIEKTFPEIEVPNSTSYSFLPTYDIDIAYSYCFKGLFRTLGGFAKDAMRLSVNNLVERFWVLLGKKNDPFDNFEYFLEWQKSYQLHPIYFFPVGVQSEFDKSLSVEKEAIKKLISGIAENAIVGLHPSYASNSNEEKIGIEKSKLEKLLDVEISRSRQHYIKLKLPATYQALLKAGIRKEYSMGYPDDVGFRASIASSFYFYDLEKEQQTNLKIYPFAIMDVTLNDYLKLSPAAALALSEKIVTAIKEVDGLFVSIWHNENVSEKANWKGWRHVYEEMLQLSLPEEN